MPGRGQKGLNSLRMTPHSSHPSHTSSQGSGLPRSPKTLIVDADALIALFHPEDALAAQAATLLERCIRDEVILLYPVTAIVEAIMTLQRKLSRPELAARVAQFVQDSQWPIVLVDEEMLATAITLFNPHGSKQNTLFDAVVAAVAQQHHADAIFSFDHWYEQAGFRLATSFFDVEVLQKGGHSAA